MEKDQEAIVVAAGIVWRNGRFFALCRPAGTPHAGFWEFPGGKLEAGESPRQALERELAEELGITVTSCNFWQRIRHCYPHAIVVLHVFHVTGYEGEPSSIEGPAARWLSPDEASGLPFLEADAPLVEQLRAIGREFEPSGD